MDEHQIARGLAWFSIGLGLAELTAPRAMGRMLGVDRGRSVMRLFGAREIAAGVGILAGAPKKAPWLWARVAGDVLDLGALVAAGAVSKKKGAVALAIVSVAAITVADVVCAGQLQREGA